MKYAMLKTLLTHEGDDGEFVELQYDAKSNLYINGKKVTTEKKVKLRWLECKPLKIPR